MKRFAAILLTVLFVVSAAVMSVSAAATWKSDKVSASTTAPSWYAGATKVEFEATSNDGTNARVNTQGDRKYVFLKNDGKKDFVIEFTIDKDGLYNIGFLLMGWSKGVVRTTDVKIDDSKAIRFEFTYTDDKSNWDQYWTGLTMELKAGKHTCTLSLTSDFDDSKVKSLYFDKFFYSYSAAIATTAAATTTKAAATTAAAAAAKRTTAPKTADISVIIAVIAVSAAAVYVVSRKH